MDQWKLDLRYAFRMLRNNPLLTIVTVVTLALGIGANTAIFSAVNGVLLEPLPFPQSDRVVVIREVDTGGSQLQVSPPNFLDWRDRQRSFSALSFSQFYGWQTVIGGVTPVRAIVERVGRDFFSLFGVAPTLGRGFSPDENTVGGPAAMIVSHSFWENQLSADSSLDRHVLNVGGESYAVIGVMPPDFRFQAEPDIWLPAERFQLSTGRTSHQLRVVGRLLDDHTVLDAYQDLQAILADIRLTVPQVSPNVSMQTMKEEITGGTRRSLLVLMGAASLLLLIACTNVASTLLARGELRHREFVMRAAMGAGRGRLVRQLLTESGLLAVLGAAVGLGVAVMLVQIIHKLASSNITRIDNVVVDLSVLTFSGAATLLTVLTFGLWPAIRASRHETTTVLRSGTSGATKQQRASWFALVTVEIAIAFALVIGSTLMIRSFWNITRVEKGFEPANLLTMDYALPESKYSEEMVPGFHDRFLADIRSLPGVTAAGLVNHLPLTGNGMFAGVKRIEAADGVRGDYRLASPGFFEAMGIQMIRGRGFQTGDGPGSIHTTVVNERLADLLWPNEDALGKQILLSGNDRHYETPLEVVGVAPTIRHRRLTALEPPTYYVNYRQRPMQSRKVVAVIRTSGPPETLIPMIRDRLHSFDRDIPAEFANMTTRVSASVINERFTMTILAGFTFIALTLAAVGVFGVVSYAVARRTREIGIRLALGAIPTAVRNMILRQSLTMVVAGAVSGTILALYLMRFIRGVLFDVDSVGLPFLLTAAAVLGVTAILATWIPARRGMRVDPITAVRSEA